MKRTPRIMTPVLLMSVGVAFVALISAAVRDSGGRQGTDDGWILIRSYVGTIDPSEGLVRARVFMKRDIPSRLDSSIVLQNRIEIGSASNVQFRWPTANDFAGSICDIVDLDGDGTKEFVIMGGVSARVVSYRRGVFRYRDRIGDGGDELVSATILDAIDIDGDGRLEFVTFGYRSLNAVGREDPHAVLSRWTQDGFRPAPNTLLETYQKKYAMVGR